MSRPMVVVCSGESQRPYRPLQEAIEQAAYLCACDPGMPANRALSHAVGYPRIPDEQTKRAIQDRASFIRKTAFRSTSRPDKK